MPATVAPARRRKLLHEAGHAVAILLLGGEVEAVFAGPTRHPGHFAVYAEGDSVELLPSALGGIAAERIAGIAPTAPVESMGPGEVPAGWRADLREFRDGAGEEPDAVARATREALSQVEDLLRRHWPIVERVAHELAVSRQLVGEELTALVAEESGR